MAKGQRLSTFVERSKWLKKHPELWKKTDEEIVLAMKKAGLVSRSTYWRDVQYLQDILLLLKKGAQQVELREVIIH